MKVILVKEVKNIGKINQVVEVSDGYAKNYLIPNKLAVAATNTALDKNKQIKAQELQDYSNKVKAFQELKKQLEPIVLEFKLKVHDNKVSKAISAKQITTALHEQYKIDIDKHKLLDFKPLNTLGLNQVLVKLMPDIIAKFHVKISGE